MPKTNSRIRGPRIGTVLEGRYGKYELKERIGSGGNGVVYSIVVKNPTKELPSNVEFALKVFVPNKDVAKRRKRFIEEIRFLQGNQEEIVGVIPIIDSSLDYGIPERECLWYLMPKAEEYDWKIQPPDRIIDDMLNVGKTLSTLHGLRGQKNAHRDIKPANLLLYNNRLCLSDFGLIWNDHSSRQHITGSGEFLGPGNIRPPEMENRRADDKVDYRFSDVYLFAKTLWIMLTANRRGFKGEYNRNNSDLLLDIDVIGERTGVFIESLEPMHQLLEYATRDYWKDRSSIDFCLGLLEKQKEIVNKTISLPEIIRYKRLEVINRARATKPDVFVYNDSVSIEKALVAFQEKRMQCRIQENSKSFPFGHLLTIANGSSQVFRLTFLTRFSKAQSVYVKIQDITIDNTDSCVIHTTSISNYPARIPMVSHVNELFFMDEPEIILNGEVQIIL